MALAEVVSLPAFRPLGARVLIEQDPPEGTSGRLIIPDAHQRVPLTGTVLAVGPDVQQVATGDRVLYRKYEGHEYRDRQIIVDEMDGILGVIE